MPSPDSLPPPPMFGMNKPFISEMAPPPDLSGPAWWFIFRGNRLLLEARDGGLHVPCQDHIEDLGVATGARHYLGRFDGRACHVVDMVDDALPGGLELKDLRQIYGAIDDDLFVLAGRAVQIAAWDRTHRYCGRCGAPTEAKSNERAMVCTKCGLMNFPRLSPAVIVMVERRHEILLARSPHFAAGMYSVLAGFVEPGETLEETVVREIKEEVGIDVTDVHYVASQSWPFPNSLMLGFTAAYAGGEIVIDPTEIEDAGWFTPDTMPPIPGRISIARRLIDLYLDKHGRRASVG